MPKLETRLSASCSASCGTSNTARTTRVPWSTSSSRRDAGAAPSTWLPEHLCLFARILKSSIFIEILLFFDLMILSRYLYIFWLKNPAGFQDDFWSAFLNILVKVFSFIFMAVWHLLANHQSLGYYICCGSSPPMAFHNPPR